MNPNAIRYLSLARKAGRIEVGEEPAGACARAGHARLLVVAGDAPENTVRRARNFVAGTEQQMVVLPFTKDEMGAALGRTSVALAAMTDPSMALAFLQALEDPKKYADAIADLTDRSRRAKLHQQEEKAHERNVRTGKKRQEARREDSQPEPAQEPARDSRPAQEDRRSHGSDRPFHRDAGKPAGRSDRPDRREAGKPADRAPRREGTWQKPAGRPDRSPRGEERDHPADREPRRSYGRTGDRPDRKPYGDRKPAYGDRPARPADGEHRRPYGDRPARPADGAHKRPYGDRPARPAEGERKSYGERDRKSAYGERKGTYGDRKPYSGGHADKGKSGTYSDSMKRGGAAASRPRFDNRGSGRQNPAVTRTAGGRTGRKTHGGAEE